MLWRPLDLSGWLSSMGREGEGKLLPPIEAHHAPLRSSKVWLVHPQPNRISLESSVYFIHCALWKSDLICHENKQENTQWFIHLCLVFSALLSATQTVVSAHSQSEKSWVGHRREPMAGRCSTEGPASAGALLPASSHHRVHPYPLGAPAKLDWPLNTALVPLHPFPRLRHPCSGIILVPLEMRMKVARRGEWLAVVTFIMRTKRLVDVQMTNIWGGGGPSPCSDFPGLESYIQDLVTCLLSSLFQLPAPGCPAHLAQGGPWGKFPVLNGKHWATREALNGSIESISFVLGPQPPLCMVRAELVL